MEELIARYINRISPSTATYKYKAFRFRGEDLT